ncbi:39S ribosomal protein L22, mitochondrial [Lecanora helva]
MSLSVPRRRQLLSSASTLIHHQCHFAPHPKPYLHSQTRSISNPLSNLFKRRKQNPQHLDAATLEKNRKEREASQKQEASRAAANPQGDLAPGSIFDDSTPTKPSSAPPPSTPDSPAARPPPKRDPHAMAAVLDPRPTARKRWQRKILIRTLQGRNRLSRTEKTLRTERSHLSKSPLIKTSVKKLYPLARQIAGKPVEEAMVQMRFSKKKAARDVLRQLELARDEAVVGRGMGLGGIRVGNEEGEQGGGEGGKGEEKRLIVEDKKGKRRVVTDETAMYVDEAWVGRGKYEMGMDYRARGRAHRLRLPYTSISVVLKEEKTRIRQMIEREQKRQKKKVWVPLPDRPITAQRQYCLW